jgi:hypothetical protein
MEPSAVHSLLDLFFFLFWKYTAILHSLEFYGVLDTFDFCTRNLGIRYLWISVVVTKNEQDVAIFLDGLVLRSNRTVLVA